MKGQRSPPPVTCLLPSLLLAACLPVTAAGEEVLDFEIAAHTVECTSEMRQRCLVVRRGDDTRWTNFYQPIDGFTHEEGFEYRIRVARREVENPVADGSRYEYRLLRVLSSGPIAARRNPGEPRGPTRDSRPTDQGGPP